MATFKSDQITKLTQSLPNQLNPFESTQPDRVEVFTFTVPAGNAAVNDLIQLCEVPAGATLQGGYFVNEAMSTGAGDASIQIGDGTTADKYLGTTSVDAASTALTWFGVTIAKDFGVVLTSKLTLTAKVITEAWAAGKKLQGKVFYRMS